MTFFILIFLIILMVSNNQLVISSASYGLMLWYKNVLPLLLPFMLISGQIEISLMKSIHKNEKQKKYAIPTILLLGLFCGYPIGAKLNAFFIKSKIISKSMGNILLPICNNISPMFFLGFIINHTLKNNINPFVGYVVIYLPYILFILLEYFIYPKDITYTQKSIDKNYAYDRNITQESINQITNVGLYIMLCCIISGFIAYLGIIPHNLKLIFIGMTEITSGVTYINNALTINSQIKTALILACTSFGGLSSIMQTSKVIQNSGLSLLHYTIIKILSAICTYFLYLLII